MRLSVPMGVHFHHGFAFIFFPSTEKGRCRSSYLVETQSMGVWGQYNKANKILSYCQMVREKEIDQVFRLEN